MNLNRKPHSYLIYVQRQKNTKGVAGMCMALIAKHGISTTSLVQQIISLILFSGQAGKQVTLKCHYILPLCCHTAV